MALLASQTSFPASITSPYNCVHDAIVAAGTSGESIISCHAVNPRSKKYCSVQCASLDAPRDLNSSWISISPKFFGGSTETSTCLIGRERKMRKGYRWHAEADTAVALSAEEGKEHLSGALETISTAEMSTTEPSTEEISKVEESSNGSTSEQLFFTPLESTSEQDTPEEEAQSDESGTSSETAEIAFYEPLFELLGASKVIPHPEKVEKGGEDAFLVSSVGAGVLCVADGVGGWAGDGVDPALYSREFVAHIEEAVESAQDQEDLDPRLLMKQAHTSTKSRGAATAIVAVLDGERAVLQVANLGDSGLRVVRKGDVIFRTQPLQHFFDCPFQLGSESSDSPDDAQVVEIEVREGDTLVMASDGLFDNVFDEDIASVVNVFGGSDLVSVQRTATALAALAAKHSADKEYMSPYVLESLDQGIDLPLWQKMLGKKLSGGKVDDITVVVAQVVRPPSD